MLIHILISMYQCVLNKYIILSLVQTFSNSKCFHFRSIMFDIVRPYARYFLCVCFSVKTLLYKNLLI